MMRAVRQLQAFAESLPPALTGLSPAPVTKRRNRKVWPTNEELPMLLSRSTVIAGSAAAAVVPGRARAAGWPDHPITLEHGFGAGGNADVIARVVAEQFSQRLGQPVVVEPKPGAGGRIA